MSKEQTRVQVWQAACSQTAELRLRLQDRDMLRKADEVGDRAGQTQDVRAALTRWRALLVSLSAGLGDAPPPLPEEAFSRLRERVLAPMAAELDALWQWDADETLWDARRRNPRASMQVVNASCSGLIARLWSADAQWQDAVSHFSGLGQVLAPAAAAQARLDAAVAEALEAADRTRASLGAFVAEAGELRERGASAAAELQAQAQQARTDGSALRRAVSGQRRAAAALLARAERTVAGLEGLAPGGGLSVQGAHVRAGAEVLAQDAARQRGRARALIACALLQAVGVALWTTLGGVPSPAALGAHAALLLVQLYIAHRADGAASALADAHAGHLRRAEALRTYGLLSDEAARVGVPREALAEAVRRAFGPIELPDGAEPSASTSTSVPTDEAFVGKVPP